MLQGRLTKGAIGLLKGLGTLVPAIAYVPDHAVPDNRGQKLSSGPAIAQDKMGQDGKDGFALRTPKPRDRQSPEPGPGIVGMAR